MKSGIILGDFIHTLLMFRMQMGHYIPQSCIRIQIRAGI